MLIKLTRAGLSSSLSSYAVCPLSPAPASFQRHWDMREGSFIGSLVLLISSLITGHYSWVSDVSPLPRTLDMMHSDTLSPTNKQLSCGRTLEALTSEGGLFLDKWISVWISEMVHLHWSNHTRRLRMQVSVFFQVNCGNAYRKWEHGGAQVWTWY